MFCVEHDTDRYSSKITGKDTFCSYYQRKKVHIPLLNSLFLSIKIADKSRSEKFTKSIALRCNDYVKYIANDLFKLFTQVCMAKEVCRQLGARSQSRRRHLSK